MQNRFQSLRIIVLALAAGQLTFLAVAVAVQRSILPPGSIDPTILPIVAVIVLLSAMTASVMLGRILRERSATYPDESSRWGAYRTSVIVRMALPEGASFLIIVFYLFTGEWLFLLLFVGSFGAFLLQRPSEDEWESVGSGSSSIR